MLMLSIMDEVRLQKLQALRDKGVIPYAAKFDRSHKLAPAKELPDGEAVSIAGRVMLFREMGKMSFATLQDHTGRLQLAFKQDDLGDEYKEAIKMIDLGDIIGIEGERFTTQKGEPTVLVKNWQMLSKALSQPPEKWHGVQDQETAWRQRYLDLTSNRESFDRFQLRSAFVKLLREFYWSHNFTEIETPVLVNNASGALATPFTSYHEAYDMEVYLRIAIETFQKECLVGGYDRTFEIGPAFRNEGLDPSHLQEFRMCEHYAAYWDYEQNMTFTEEMLSSIIQELHGSLQIQIPDRDGNVIDVDFTPPWPKISIYEAVQKGCGIDLAETQTADELRAEMKKKKVQLEVPVEALGRGNLIDQLYKKVSRPDIVQPTFLTKHPVELSPLARINDDDPTITDRFQLVVGGWEIVNAYSELVDAVDQAQRFEEQAKAHSGGDADAHEKDDEFVKALSYGCPPCSGWGMGIDRIVALLSQQMNLRDVTLFPLMKPDQPKLSAKQEEERYRSKQIIIIGNKDLNPGIVMNAVGQVGLEIGAFSKENLFDTKTLIDADGRVHYSNGIYPNVNLAGTREEMATFALKCYEKNIQLFDFSDIQRKVHTDVHMLKGYAEKKTKDIGYIAVGALVPTGFEEEFIATLPLYGSDDVQSSQSHESSMSSTSSHDLPDENSKRFIAVLNKKAEMGRLMNALGHMTAGLSDLASRSEDLCFLEYEDADGGSHPNISHFPFIVLKADNSNKIRKVREQALEKDIPFTDFTSTMTIGGSQQQQDATKESKEEDLEYLGICLFGNTKELKELTGKFSLFG